MVVYNERARRVIDLAHREAKAQLHDHIGTEHLLLGLIEEREGMAARLLESLGVTRESARAQIEEIVGPGQGSPSGRIPLSSRARRALADARPLARRYRRRNVDTEHILLALALDEGAASRALVNLGADSGQLRRLIAHDSTDLPVGSEPGPASTVRWQRPSEEPDDSDELTNADEIAQQRATDRRNAALTQARADLRAR